MVVAVNQSLEGGYDRYLHIKSMDGETMSKAEGIFSFYQEKHVILSGRLEDNLWELSDERTKIRLCFSISEPLFHKNAMPWIGCGFACFRSAVKAYALFKMGSLSLRTLCGVVNTLRRLGEMDFDGAAGIKRNAGHAAELLGMVPGYSTERDAAIEALEENNAASGRRHGGQRALADFRSYFRFHDELAKFWKAAGEAEKLFYFPLYLWWNLTAVLPLRPTEFLMTPRECLSVQEAGDCMSVRRTRLKGGAKLTYTIEGDFDVKKYPVSRELAGEIRWYMEMTDRMTASPVGALFRREACTLYKRWDKGTAVDTAYNYSNLSNALKIFRQEVLPGRDDIAEIHLGDTRHIAMMNLVISGGSPSVCMELAGHGDIDISSHYYANMAGLVECATYEMYRKGKKGSMAAIKGSREYSMVPAGGHTRIKDGWCCSDARMERRVDDCIMAVSPAGEIGDCKSCRYFRADRQGVELDFYDPVRGKEAVDADSWFLMYMVEAVRQGIGRQEDIRSAMLRLQQSCGHYRDCLLKNYGKDVG